jgi:hypothetical protein
LNGEYLFFGTKCISRFSTQKGDKIWLSYSWRDAESNPHPNLQFRLLDLVFWFESKNILFKFKILTLKLKIDFQQFV